MFGTRPEVIKLAPVIHELQKNAGDFETVVVSSGQHAELIQPFIKLFKIKIAHDLRVMSVKQTPNTVCAKVITAFDKILAAEKPDLVLVQGDTTTTLAGALTAFNRRLRVGHVEAGLRSGDPDNPFPEEMNRRLISQLATLHFAATESNQAALQSENVAAGQIFVTGNPVVDALGFVLRQGVKSRATRELIARTTHLKPILLTTHRRENWGATMRENLIALSEFVAAHPDTALLFPVHPNPAVRAAVMASVPAHSRIFLLEPLDYADFIALMKHAWLVVSDSGGVQEEAPSLGKPLLILRKNTERPEAVAAGVARLVGGGGAKKLSRMLAENYANQTWINSVGQIPNPFGDGAAAKRIVAGLLATVSAPPQLAAK